MKPLYNIYCGNNTIDEAKEVWDAIWNKSEYKGSTKVFEQKLREFVGHCEWIKSYGAGRQALYSILKAIGIKVGDEVILQAFTCVAVPKAIKFAGGLPVYVDISKSNNFLMDLKSLKSKITNRTKAVIVQHTFGKIMNIHKVREVVGDRIYIIEDCAHTIKILQGDAGFISTDHTKIINTGIGGVAFTNKKEIGEKLEDGKHLSKIRQLQIALSFIAEVYLTHPKIYRIGKYIKGILNKTHILFAFRDENKKKKPKYFPSAMPDISAYIGVSQLENFGFNLFHRVAICHLLGYNEDWLLLPMYFKPLPPTFDEASKRFGNFEVSNWFDSPVFGCKKLKDVDYKIGSCPNAENLSKRISNLPVNLRIPHSEYYNNIYLEMKWSLK